MDEEGQSSEEQRALLESRIAEARSIADTVDREFANVDGANKFKNRIKAELRFLIDLRKKPSNGLKRYIETSNVVHFRGLLNAAYRYDNCRAFYKSFTKPDQKKGRKLEVDLVVEEGAKWVKVISRSARGLAMEYVGAGGGTSRSILEQAQDYVKMAVEFPYFFKTPVIVFEFLSGVPDLLARQIEGFGVVVAGTLVPIGDLVKLPEDSDEEDVDDDSQSTPELSSSSTRLKGEGLLSGALAFDTVNLDVTAIFALISSLTHPGGCGYHFESSLLNAQAALERKKPALAPLLKVIEGKKLIICRSAYDSVQSILSTVAGPEEKKRAKSLFENVEVVDDKLTERAAKLRISDKISPRSKIIFGSGDYYKAVTISANRHFVSAASHQGIHFAVILHESRALSEQKERSLKTSKFVCGNCFVKMIFSIGS
uniref:DUF1308 domain-containing protein n=1 Tax=Parascaris univalens TaxID=6257 RepID=A0A915AQH5_PARUN